MAQSKLQKTKSVNDFHAHFLAIQVYQVKEGKTKHILVEGHPSLQM